MQDYIPQDPNRKKIIHADGSVEYVHIESADNPVANNPTPLNKATLLDDNTAAILKIPNTATPNDALQKLALGEGKYGYSITILDIMGKPMQGRTVSGITTPGGNTCITDSAGNVFGVSTKTAVSISVSAPYLDYQDLSQTVTSTGLTTAKTLTFSAKPSSEIYRIYSSGTINFSKYVAFIDATCVGAGGGGGSYATTGGDPGGAGGGGGYVRTAMNVTISLNQTISCTIGGGGAGGEFPAGSHKSGLDGTSGGTTQLMLDGVAVLSASGGGGGGGWQMNTNSAIGGSGNGKGGGLENSAVYHGTNGSGYLFNDSSLGVAGGGGGNFGSNSGNNADTFAGAPNGGHFSAGGTGGGGGGGSMCPYASEPWGVGRSGGSGMVAVRARYS